MDDNETMVKIEERTGSPGATGEPRDASGFGINPRETGVVRLDFASIFGNDHPVALEVGSGKGRFLVASASARPEVNFVGIEKSLHYYRVIRTRLQRHALPNARIVNYDAFEVVRRMVPDASLSEVHIYFPDPWPRPRERKRRMIRDEVMTELVRVMRPEAKGIYVTDHQEYFEKAIEVLRGFFDAEVADAYASPPRTNYEAKYREAGRPIYEARFTRRG
jgi:tRNA (guanine-N7-)-methyltransferase